MKLRNVLFFIVFLYSSLSFAQQKAPFYEEVQAFKKADSLQMPVKNGILFIGSSSFTIWKTLESTYRTYQPINRGFGGSTLANAIYYAEDLIFPYQPRQVVIYSGENDIAEGYGPDLTFDRFKLLFHLIRKKLPQAYISYISIKPSVSREKFMPQMVYANELIKTFLSTQANTHFIDVYHSMLQPNGKPMTDIFLQDNLHMNTKGYDIWIKTITPYLTKK